MDKYMSMSSIMTNKQLGDRNTSISPIKIRKVYKQRGNSQDANLNPFMTTYQSNYQNKPMTSESLSMDKTRITSHTNLLKNLEGGDMESRGNQRSKSIDTREAKKSINEIRLHPLQKNSKLSPLKNETKQTLSQTSKLPNLAEISMFKKFQQNKLNKLDASKDKIQQENSLQDSKIDYDQVQTPEKTKYIDIQDQNEPESPEKEPEQDFSEMESIIQMLPNEIVNSKTFNLQKFIEQNKSYIEHLLKKCECYTCDCGNPMCQCDFQKNQKQQLNFQFQTRYGSEFRKSQQIQDINSKYQLSLENYESGKYLIGKERVVNPVSITKTDFVPKNQQSPSPKNKFLEYIKKEQKLMQTTSNYKYNYPNWNIVQEKEKMKPPIEKTWDHENKLGMNNTHYKTTFKGFDKTQNTYPPQDNKRVLGPMTKSYSYDRLESHMKKDQRENKKYIDRYLEPTNRDGQLISDHHKAYNLQASGISGFEGQYKTHQMRTFDLKFPINCKSQNKKMEKRERSLKQLDQDNISRKQTQLGFNERVMKTIY